MRSRTLFLSLLALLVASILVTSAGSATAQSPDTANVGFVRFMHAAIDVPPIDIYVGSDPKPVAASLSYRQFTDFVALPTNLSGYTARAAGSGPNGAVLFRLDWGVKANKSELIVAVGLAARKSFVLEPLTLVRNETKGKARVRVFNTVSGGAHLSVSSKQGVAFSKDQDYLNASADSDVAPGPYNFETKDDTGRLTTNPLSLTLEADKVYTLVLVGGAGGNPPISIIPIISDQETTRVQIINKSGSAFDVYVKGEAQPLVAGVTDGQSTDFIGLPSRAVTLVLHKPGSGAAGKEMGALELQLHPGRDTVITLSNAGGVPQLAITSETLTQLTPSATASATMQAAPTMQATAAATAAG